MSGDPKGGIVIPLVEIDGEHTPEPVVGTGIESFAQLAEYLLPTCRLIDAAWASAERAEEDLHMELADLTAAIMEVAAPTSTVTNREERRSKTRQTIDRNLAALIVDVTSVIRYGVYEQVNDGEINPSAFYGYSLLCRAMAVPVNAAKSPLDRETQQRANKQLGELRDAGINRLAPEYGTIYQLSPMVLQSTADYFSFGLKEAASFVEWLEQVDANKDTTDFQGYLALLATNLLQKNGTTEPTIMQRAVKALEITAETELRTEFINALLSGAVRISDNTTNQFIDMLKQMMGYDPAVHLDGLALQLVAVQEHWPDSLKEDYKGYYQYFIERYEKRMKAVLEKHIDTRLQEPSKIQVNRVLGEWQRGEQAIRGNRMGHAAVRATRRAAARSAKRPSLATPPEGKEEQPQTVVAILKETSDGVHIEYEGTDEALDEMIRKYCSSYHEDGLQDSVTALKDYVIKKPFGYGTQKMAKEFSVSINHRSFRLRHGMIRRNGEVTSSGNVAYRTRIFYAVINERGKPPVVAIKEILDHDAMDVKYNP